MSIQNQWPDFATLPKSEKTVRGVLLEEGSGLATKTRDEILFHVDTVPREKGSPVERRGFSHQCSLFVPKLTYRYPFIRIDQETLDYPVTVYADDFPQGWKAAGNEAEFRKILGSIFRSDQTQKIVRQLLDLLS
jgi:hypothetical protein